MKRREFIRYLETRGCVLIREGKKHSVFLNKLKSKVSTVPRHNEISGFLCRKICRDLEIPSP